MTPGTDESAANRDRSIGGNSEADIHSSAIAQRIMNQFDAPLAKSRGLGAGVRAFQRWTNARRRPLVDPAKRAQPGAASSLVQLARVDGKAARRTGAVLPSTIRATMEPLVGTGLSDVRIHTGKQASATATRLGAAAFTVGQDVYFGDGNYDPVSPRGRALLAHELVHVRQQKGADIERVARYGDDPSAAEIEAQTVEHAVLRTPGGADGTFSVGTYTRNYESVDGRPLSPGDTARLDTISRRALEICQRELGADLRRIGAQSLTRLMVDVTIDLASMSDEQAATIWGRALADRIRQAIAQQRYRFR